jgi:alpha-beta hydrolase superfamily lysophospholipase
MNEKHIGFISSSAFRAMPLNEYRVERIPSIYPENSKGVALVIHGLNLKPDKMDSIITLLTQFDIDVLKMSLSGHGKNYTPKLHSGTGRARMETFKRVSFRLWREETYKAYDIAEKMSREKSVPLFLVGYSLGGLMGVDLFATWSAAYFNRMVLLAPALNLHILYYAAKFLLPFPKLVIPSFSPASYRANFGTPVAAYRALFETIEHLHQNMTSKLNVPTIVIIDPKDELVPYQRLEKTIKSRNFDHWKFHLLKKSVKDAKKIPHHLIIDESTAGNDSWNKMKHLIIRHLLG